MKIVVDQDREILFKTIDPQGNELEVLVYVVEQDGKFALKYDDNQGHERTCEELFDSEQFAWALGLNVALELTRDFYDEWLNPGEKNEEDTSD